MKIETAPLKAKYIKEISNINKQIAFFNRKAKAVRELLTSVKSDYTQDEYYFETKEKSKQLKDQKAIYLKFIAELS